MPLDSLTGLLDHQSFIEAQRRLRAEGGNGSLALLDLDHFKVVNDRYGHAFGDEILKALARHLTAWLPPGTPVARMGGEEFGVLLPGLDVRAAQRLMVAICDRMREPFVVGEQSIVVTVSIGLVAFPGDSAREAFAAADTAVYVAKVRGRDQCVVYGDDVRSIVARRRELATAVVELQGRIRELQTEARTDALTGLFNRRALDEVMDVRCNASRPAGTAVVFVDIDHFSEYNKLHTDAGGDVALRAVAQALRACARDGDDMVFRKGGEELVAVLFGVESADAAWVAAERMRLAVEALAIAHTGSRTAPIVTVTVGVAWGDADETVRQLLEQAADLVMAAKRNGQRNRVHGRPDR